jgi:hypothetical protein
MKLGLNGHLYFYVTDVSGVEGMPEGSQTNGGSQNRNEEDFYDQGLAPGNDRRSVGRRSDAKGRSPYASRLLLLLLWLLDV